MPHLTRTEQSVLYARMQEPKSGLQTGSAPYRLYGVDDLQPVTEERRSSNGW
jgi:hypothetical protein